MWSIKCHSFLKPSVNSLNVLFCPISSLLVVTISFYSFLGVLCLSVYGQPVGICSRCTVSLLLISCSGNIFCLFLLKSQNQITVLFVLYLLLICLVFQISILFVEWFCLSCFRSSTNNQLTGESFRWLMPRICSRHWVCRFSDLHWIFLSVDVGMPILETVNVFLQNALYRPSVGC